jgi:hypothetical protein
MAVSDAAFAELQASSEAPIIRLIRDIGLLRRQTSQVDWLEEHIRVEVMPDSEILRISLTGGDPTTLVKIVNAVTNVYVEEEFEREEQRRMKTADRLAKLKDDYDEKLHTARTQCKTLAKQAGLADPKNANYKYRLLLDELAAAKIDLAQARSVRYKLEAELTVGAAEHNKDVGDVKHKLAVQKVLEERLLAIVKTLTDETKDMSDSSIDLKDYEERIKQYQELVNQVSRAAEMVRVELDEPARITILDPAAVD